MAIKLTNKLLKKITFVILIVSTISAIILSVFVYYYPVLTFDIAATKYLQAEGSSPLEKGLILYFLKGVSFLGIPTITVWLVLITAFCFWLLKYYREAIYFLSTLLAPVANYLIKSIIHRPRPAGDIQIFDHQLTTSFPSGHVMFYTVFFGFLFTSMFFTTRIPAFWRYMIVVISIFLIITVSISRVFLGAHWFTDALGGYLFGFILLSILLYFYLKKFYQSDTSK